MRTHLVLAAVLLLSCATHQARGPGEPKAPIAAERDDASTRAVDEIIAGDYQAALALADKGLQSHKDPWLLYDKGVALAGLNRLDDALRVLREAEELFPARELHGRSIAAYRRALSLEFAGRCAEASTEFSHYAAMLRSTQPSLADDAIAHLKYCIPPSRLEAIAARPAFADEASRRAEEASSAAVYAMIRGDYAEALAHAERGLVDAPEDPWLLYNKGTALLELQRFDEGLAFLRSAEQRFSNENVHGRSGAIYRRALAREGAGRCDDAAVEYQHYAAAVVKAEPLMAEHALSHRNFCRRANPGRKTF